MQIQSWTMKILLAVFSVLVQTELAVAKFYDVLFTKEQIPTETVQSSLVANYSGLSETSCTLKCERQNCASAIIDTKENRCLLFKAEFDVKEMDLTDEKDESTRMIIIKEKKWCGNVQCRNGGTCLETRNDVGCSCLVGWTGSRCEIKDKNISCQDVKSKYKHLDLKNGFYELQWGDSPPFQVYCDMERDGGGWTRILHVLANATKVSGVHIKLGGTLQEIDPYTNYQLSQHGLIDLKGNIEFKQFYYFCKNNNLNRTISIKSLINSTSVLQYLMKETDVRPGACGTYHRFEDDNSELTRDCSRIDEGKWGSVEFGAGYTDHVLFIHRQLHLIIANEAGRLECDNYNPSDLHTKDIWEVYVR